MVPKDKSQLTEELRSAEKELARCRKTVTDLRRQMQPEEIAEYAFKTPGGKDVSLADLFGDKDDLVVVHNMGKHCPCCTLWADGLNGVYQHLENRAVFAVVSPDAPGTVKEFAGGRGWKFTILPNNGGPFSKDMGYESDKGEPWPGVSTFRRDTSGKIRRVSHAPFGPGDNFCSVWHIFDMLESGADGWQPKFKY